MTSAKPVPCPPSAAPRGWPSTSAKVLAKQHLVSVGRDRSTPRETRNTRQDTAAATQQCQHLTFRLLAVQGQKGRGLQEPGPHRPTWDPNCTSNLSQTSFYHSGREQGSLWCNEWGPDFTSTPQRAKSLTGAVQSDPCTWLQATPVKQQSAFHSKKQNDHQVSPSSSAATANVRTHCTSQGNII